MKRIAAFPVALLLLAGGLAISRDLADLQLWLFGLGLAGLVGIAADIFLQRPASDPSGETEVSVNLITVWSSPGFVVVSGLWLVHTLPADSMVGIVAAGTLMLGALLVGILAGDASEQRFKRAGRFVANLVLYLGVFLLFALIYHTKERSLFTATGIGLVSLLAGLELLHTPREGQEGQPLPWRMAGLVALLVAETTWALNYWPVSGLVGGALLLLAFYVIAGLVQAVQEGALDRQALVEYGTVGVVGILAISWAIP